MRGIIGHYIVVSWEELGVMAVSVLALVFTSIDTLVGRRAFRGDGALGDSRDSRGVVAHGADGGISHWVSMRNDADLS